MCSTLYSSLLLMNISILTLMNICLCPWFELEKKWTRKKKCQFQFPSSWSKTHIKRECRHKMGSYIGSTVCVWLLWYISGSDSHVQTSKLMIFCRHILYIQTWSHTWSHTIRNSRDQVRDKNFSKFPGKPSRHSPQKNETEIEDSVISFEYCWLY